MTLSPLSAISPIDGRYHNATKDLSSYFSEGALIKYRVYVEIEYFIALCELPLPQLKAFDSTQFGALRDVYKKFSDVDAEAIKTIERTTNHDVKAVEYFIKSVFDKLALSEYKEFIHFGLTSQDINNTSIPHSFKLAIENSYYPILNELINNLKAKADEWKDIPLLAHTHGQPASPTRLGKEIQVFVERLENQFYQLKQIPYSAKFGGATGNFNAHHVAYPQINWVDFANNFINKTLNLNRSQYTTQ
ncbi:MAG: purB, partial [Daejeonella sp.]|nr:purB [Daejeonella sp.]